MTNPFSDVLERVAKAIERVRFAPFINDGGPSKMDLALAKAALDAIDYPATIERLSAELERVKGQVGPPRAYREYTGTGQLNSGGKVTVRMVTPDEYRSPDHCGE